MKKYLLFLLLVLSFETLASVTYFLPTHIGNQVFNDILVIESEMPLKGTLTGPGRFSSPLMDGSFTFSWDAMNISFTIRLRENGKLFNVRYSLFRPHGEKKIEGTLHLENGALLGHVVNGYEIQKQ